MLGIINKLVINEQIIETLQSNNCVQLYRFVWIDPKGEKQHDYVSNAFDTFKNMYTCDMVSKWK